jgi:hypothetical protein
MFGGEWTSILNARLREALTEHERAMREEVIPQIEADLREQARLAHYLRLGIRPPGRDHVEGTR